jgi:hypothetical protein
VAGWAARFSFPLKFFSARAVLSPARRIRRRRRRRKEEEEEEEEEENL